MTDVVVAGGGLIGLAVAWRAAVAGLSVRVVDRDPGSGASRAAAGMLAPVTEASYGEERLTALALASLARYPDFLEEVERASGLEVPLRRAGTLLVGFDEDDVRVLTDLSAFHAELGLDAERLTPRQARSREPGLTPRVRGALLSPGDSSVDARALHAALRVAAGRAGVELVASPVRRLLVDGSRAAGLGTDAGEVRGDAVVLALGAWSGRLDGVPDGLVPVRPVKGQILRLRGEPVVHGTVRALVRGRAVYLVPYGEDGLVVGASVEEAGFDGRVTAGAVLDLLRDAADVVPGVTELELAETLASWRPGTPDNAPLLGACGLPGLVLATGHHRNGVLLTPVTADAVTTLLLTGGLPEVAAPFATSRFGREAAPCG